MPRFTVVITRDATESTSITVVATHAEAAQAAASAQLASGTDAVWSLDERSWNSGDPYVTAVSLACES